MSTNFYLVTDQLCPHCNTIIRQTRHHIGLSSVGWAFALRGGERANTLNEWIAAFDNGTIIDEYGAAVSKEEMIQLITCRAGYITQTQLKLSRARSTEGRRVVSDPFEDYDVCFYEFS